MTVEPDGLRILGLLDSLQSRYGPQVFGQLMQSLLAAAFAQSGYQVIPNVIGVPDFTATKEAVQQGFGVEVKTTGNGSVILSERDLSGVMNSGHIPVIAILNYPSDNPIWHLLDAAALKPGTYKPFRLIRKPKVSIDFDVNSIFRSLLAKHYSAAIESTSALEHALKTFPRRARGRVRRTPEPFPHL